MDIGGLAKIDNIFSFLAFISVIGLGFAQLKKKSSSDEADDRTEKLISEHEKDCLNMKYIEGRLASIERRLDQIMKILMGRNE